MSLNDDMKVYASQLRLGNIQRAYRGVLSFMSDLKAYMEGKYPAYSVGSLYCGYMDMTYFAFTPPSLKDRKLKIAIVFLHETCRFDIWLAAANRKTQADTIALLATRDLGAFRLSSIGPGVDSIIEASLVEQPDFNDTAALKSNIEEATLRFIGDILPFLQ